MGNWTIEIRGHGIHHNGRQEDANAMAAVFVGELRAAGHEITDARFTLTGHAEDIPAVAVTSTSHAAS